MILGHVNANREAIIQIAVLSDRKKIKGIKAVIDTGYTGDLMLPRVVIEELNLTLRGIQDAILGDGSIKIFGKMLDKRLKEYERKNNPAW
jgi:predicted aspartyl protease